MSKFKAASLLSPQPKKRAEEGEHPLESATEFNQAEINDAAKAMQQPIMEAVKGTRDAVVKAGKTVINLPIKAADAGLNVVTRVTGTTAEIIGKTIAAGIELPVKTASFILTAPPALAFNIIRHAYGLAVKMPISTALIAASYIGRGLNFVSATARTVRDSVNETIDKPANFIRRWTEDFNKRINSITIPGSSDAPAHAH